VANFHFDFKLVESLRENVHQVVTLSNAMSRKLDGNTVAAVEGTFDYLAVAIVHGYFPANIRPSP
jgi:hypothetical protein